MPRTVRHFGIRALLLVGLVSLCAAASAQQNAASSLVEVYWHGSKTVTVAGLSNAVCVDDDICRPSVDGDQLQLFGLARGETVALAWAGNAQYTFRVRVVAPPVKIVPRLQSPADRLQLGQGSFSTSFLRSSAAGSATSVLLSQMDWSQVANGRGMILRAQTQDQFAGGGRQFGINSASLQFFTPNSSAWIGDFLLTSPIESESHIVPTTTYTNLVLRGADFWTRRGRNRIEAFAGSTVPPYFLSLSGTRSIAGVSLTRQLSQSLYGSIATGFVNVVTPTTPSVRQTLPYQTASVAYARGRWKTEATAGGSTRGAMLQASASYSGAAGTAYAAVTRSADAFPLNQLQLFFTGGSSVSGGGMYRVSTRAAVAGYFQHSASGPFGGRGASSGNYANPNLTWRVTDRHQIIFNYALTTADQQGTMHTTGHRIDVLANSSLGMGLANSAQVSVGRMRDRGEINSENNLSLRDVLTIPTKRGIFSLGVQHVRTDPSLAGRLAANLNLLTPAERQAIAADPIGFSSNYPLSPQTRLLLSEIQPSTTEATVGAQFNVRQRLSVSPSVRLAHDSTTVAGQSAFHASAAYSLVYAITPKISVQSSLSQVFDVNSGGRLQRSNALTFGLRKSFDGRPNLGFAHHHRPDIAGQVCVDLNVDGRCSQGEPGKAGIEVVLDGRTRQVSDGDGHFRFAGVKAGSHRVSVATDHLAAPIRFTSVSDVPVDVADDDVELEFTVVSFARVMGNVYNDYLLNGMRQPDAPGLPRVRLILSASNGFTRSVNSDGSGDFEMMEVPPGDYTLTVDPASIPPDYQLGETAATFHVAPVSTVVHDVPVRALRSMSGHVYVRIATANPEIGPPAPPRQELRPASGVQLRVAGQIVTTDDSGEFLARDLPAGEVAVEVLPAANRGATGLRLPSGRVRLSKDPTQLNTVRIVISDPQVARAVHAGE